MYNVYRALLKTK